MRCVFPDGVLTLQERECCEAMGDQCGQIDMPASHSCCKVTLRPLDSFPVIARFTHSQPQTVVPLPAASNIFSLVHVSQTASLAQTHSPPRLLAEAISTLRI